MSTPIDWTHDDAGFEIGPYNGKRTVTKLNSQVAGLAVFESLVTGSPVSYKDMYYTLTVALQVWANKPGRRSEQRKFWQENPEATLHQYRMPKDFYRPYIEATLPVVWVSTNWIGAGTKLHLDNGVFEEDKPILTRLSGDELVPVVKGVARYPWDPNQRFGGGSRMVYGYWTTP